MRSQTQNDRPSRLAGATLWTLQILLAALFLMAGVMKLVMPLAALTAQSTLPGGFLRFIGVMETLGALGLVLPGLLRVQTRLTPLAAAGLVPIIAGATWISAAQGVGAAAFPCVIGVLAASIAWGRWQWAPLRSRAHRPTLRSAVAA